MPEYTVVCKEYAESKQSMQKHAESIQSVRRKYYITFLLPVTDTNCNYFRSLFSGALFFRSPLLS